MSVKVAFDFFHCTRMNRRRKAGFKLYMVVALLKQEDKKESGFRSPLYNVYPSFRNLISGKRAVSRRPTIISLFVRFQKSPHILTISV